MFYYYYCAVTEAAVVILAMNDAAVLQFIHTAIAVVSCWENRCCGYSCCWQVHLSRHLISSLCRGWGVFICLYEAMKGDLCRLNNVCMALQESGI